LTGAHDREGEQDARELFALAEWAAALDPARFDAMLRRYMNQGERAVAIHCHSMETGTHPQCSRIP